MKNITSKILLAAFFLTITSLKAQIGIGTTVPYSQLDIRSSNQATPTNTDGILIPKVDTFPASNPGVDQQGMLVYLAAPTTFGGNPKAIGFYYWDDNSSDWIGISSTANGDHDWYEEGTTTAPNAITDNMFHNGNVAIGKNTANSALDVFSSAAAISGISNVLNSTVTAGGTTIKLGISNSIQGNSNDVMTGQANLITNSGTGIHYGVNNEISSPNSSFIYGFNNAINSNSSTFGSNNNITNNSTSTLSTVHAYSNNLAGTSAGTIKGYNSTIGVSGNGDHYGNYNLLAGTGTGIKYGTYNLLNSAAGGTHYGIYSEVLKAGATNFAGYFLGNVGIGTTGANMYTFPASRGTNGQVMQTNGTGVVSWANPNGFAWTTVGNSVTTAGTNFIGTTDANDFVTKTGGSAAANERLRVKTAGQVVVNNTGIFPGDAFSAYASNTTNGTTASINNTIGTFAVNGYSSGNGTGVYGEVNGGATTAGSAIWGNLYGTTTTASSTSEAVWGTNSTAPAGTGVTAAVATGVRGESSGAAGTAFTMGVLGTNSATAGSAFGVYGQTSSPASMGVFGVNLDVSAAPAHGIQGQTGAVGSAAGVRGFNTAAAIGAGQNGFGVRGTANIAPTGTGFVMAVRGDSNGATGSTYGVYGQVASATGFGMYALNTNANGTGLVATGNNAAATILASGAGATIFGTTLGTLSLARTPASGVGLIGVGNNLTGSIFSPASGAGTVGVGTQYGVMGFATTTVNTNPGNNNAANGAAASAGGYFEVQNAGVAQTWTYVGVRDNGGVLRKIIGPGTVNTIVNDTNGKRVALSCPETPENLFQDYGQGQLINGKAHIEIDPIFAKNIVVNEKHPLRVFVQLEGDCEGVFISNKSQNGFDVTELKNGNSNVAFSFSIVANRADEMNPDGTMARYSEERFAAAPGPQITKKLETLEENTAARNLASDDKPASLPNIKTKPNQKLRKQK